jgi:hypothetical protein
MPHEEIQGERVEYSRFRFDEAVIRGRSNGELCVGEYAKQLDGLLGTYTITVTDE